MNVFVQVKGAESFPIHQITTKEELLKLLDFARIGSQKGEPRLVYKIARDHRRQLIARYENGQSTTTAAMRARRNPLWGLVGKLAMNGLHRVING